MKAKANIKTQKRGKPKSDQASARRTVSRKGKAKQVQAIAPVQIMELLERISDGFVVLDKNWRYIYVNQKAAEMLQRQKPSDLIGKHIWTEYPEGVDQPFHLAYEKAMDTQTPIVMEDHYAPWDRWFENRIYPSAEMLCILFTEITERKRIEKALQASEARLQAAIDAAEIGLWDWDLISGQIIWLGHHDQLFGFAVGEFDGTYASFEKRIHPEDLVELNRVVQRARAERSDYSHEYRVIWPDDSIHWIAGRGKFLYNEAGEAVRMYGAVLDRTEYKRAEEAVHESEQKFSKIFYASPVPVSINRESDGRYIDVNESFLRRMGYQREEVIGRTALEINAWAEPGKRPDMLQMLNELGSLRNFEARFRTKSGEIGIGLLFREILELAGEKYFIGTTLDITDRKRAEEALAASETELRALFASMKDVVLVIDRDGIYRQIAPTNPNLLYKPSEELLGRTLQEVFPKEQAESFIGTIRQVVETQQTAHIEYQLTINERVVWFEAAISPMEVASTLWVARDITERKQAELEISRLFAESQRRLRQVEALRLIDLAISASMDLRTTLNVLLRYVESLLGVDASAILLFNSALQQFQFSAGRGFHTTDIEHASVRLGTSFAGRAASERKTISLSSDLAAQVDSDFLKMYQREGFLAYSGVPLIAKYEIKGVMEVYHRSPHQPESEWLNLLETLANQAAIAIDNAQLFNGLQQSNIELALAYDATIAGWSRAMDLRDKETEGHTQRVADLTLKLARAMSISESQLTHIRRGALLHDIGKMGVPDNILLKADQLTDEEWEKMRKHPEFAYEMLSSIRYLQPALDIPYCHHEKWDGTGYPRSLKGEEIPIAARIFAVVDVWDAITNDRPYRKAWPHERAREYIQEQSGKYFDPHIVEVFLNLISDQ
jgi:PAS domain S-box-containing protein/putative nucleotidyltransferase with HDIG domain